MLKRERDKTMASNNSMANNNSTNVRDGNSLNITLEELNDRATENYLSVLIFCVVVMVIGIVGNVLVLIIYKLKFKRSSARTYILALAIADLSVCLVGIPYHVLDLTMLLVYRYTNTCKILSFLIGICTNSSVFILLVVGLDRYLKVCRPLKKQIIDFGDRRACLIAVAFAVLLSIPNGILYGHSSVSTDVEGLLGVQCFIDDDFVESVFAVAYFGFNILVFILSLVFLVVIYWFICKKIYQQDKTDGEMNLSKSTKRCCGCFKQEDEDESDDEKDGITSREEMVGLSTGNGGEKAGTSLVDEKTPLADLNTDNNQEANKSDQEDKVNTENKPSTKGTNPQRKVQNQSSSGMVRHVQNKEKNTRKITLMMLAITAVFCFSYLPFITVSILTAMDEKYWDDMGLFESIFSDLILRIYLINNIANPIIYSFLDRRFRKECIKLFKRLCGCGSDDRKSKHFTSSAYSKSARNVTVVTRTR